MELQKNYRINSLFEFYFPLLTKKQNEYMQLYYVDDYSLGEISEEFKVSRQAVYDNINRTELILEKYEHDLKLYHDFMVRNNKLDIIRMYVQNNYKNDKYLNDLINNLSNFDEK